MPLTDREQEVLGLLRADARLRPIEIARRLRTSRAAVAVHLSALTKKGLIHGRGYILADEAYAVAVGGANMDLKSQLLGSPVMGSSNPARAVTAPGGVARNIAHNLALLGRKVTLLSAVGQDGLGDRLMAESNAAGIDTHHVLRLPEPTGLYAATLDESGQLILATAAMAIMAQLTPDYLRTQERLLASASLIVADDNPPAASLDWLGELAGRRGLKLAIASVSAPKANKIAVLLRALSRSRWPLFALFCNRAEIEALVDQPPIKERGLQAALRELHGRGVRHIAVSLGRDGVLASSRMDYGIAHGLVPAVAGEIVDVTGAGDAAVAGTIHGLMNGLDMVPAAALGQAAAALTVQSVLSVNPALNGARVEELRRTSFDAVTGKQATTVATQ